MSVSFMKRGKAAEAARAQEDSNRSDQGNRVFRFWVPKDGESQITFLDGALDADGLLDNPSYYEHQMQINGSWQNWFVCTQDSEPCPICEDGNRPSLVTLFLVLNRTGYTSKKTGKEVKDMIQLVAAKSNSIKMLNKKASKYGGLKGVTFDVARTGDQSPAIGNDYDFVEKVDTEALLKGLDLELPKYEDLIVYRNADELRKLGFGGTAPMGSETAVSESDDEDF